MRMMVKALIPTPAGSKGIKDGVLPETVKKFIETARPESIYFGAEGGMRAMWAVIDLKEASDLPPYCEPLFMNLDAGLTISPVMSGDDLAAGFGKLNMG